MEVTCVKHLIFHAQLHSLCGKILVVEDVQHNVVELRFNYVHCSGCNIHDKTHQGSLEKNVEMEVSLSCHK